MPSPTTAPRFDKADIDVTQGGALVLTKVWQQGELLPDFAADQVRDDLDALREAGLITIHGEQVSLTLAGRARLAIDRLRSIEDDEDDSSCGATEEDRYELTDEGRAYLDEMKARL